jgi:FkbM family methyltransferase
MKGSYWIVKTEHGDFLTDKNDFIGSQLYKKFVWEPEVIDICTQLIKPHYTVLDIGAHMGFHTINFAKLAKSVYAFEPQKRLYNQLRGNVFLNEFNDKISCFNIGLGEKNKKSSFGDLYEHNTKNWDGDWDEAINYGGRPLEDDLGTNEITIKTLDSLNISPDFIKMDVEGYELKTLQGAINTLKAHSPTILFETFTENYKIVFKFLFEIGYKIFSNHELETYSNYIAIHPDSNDYEENYKIMEEKFYRFNY